jgi:alkylhydroperoxidase family enzyme
VSDATIDPTEPRLPPIPVEERSERVRTLLDPLRSGNLNILRTIAHHEDALDGLLSLGRGLHAIQALKPRLRELLILRTAVNCDVDYEWGQHARSARDLGMEDDELQAVVVGPADPRWSRLEAALLSAADQLHRTCDLEDATWGVLLGALGPDGLLEVLMTAGQYHLVAFVIKAARVQQELGAEAIPHGAS